MTIIFHRIAPVSVAVTISLSFPTVVKSFSHSQPHSLSFVTTSTFTSTSTSTSTLTSAFTSLSTPAIGRKKRNRNRDRDVIPLSSPSSSTLSSLLMSSLSTEAEEVKDSNNIDIDNDNSNNIVILGGGFGGLNTALTLDSLPWPLSESNSNSNNKPKIILVDNKERFVFLPLLYELCIGDAELKEVAPTFQSLLKNNDNIDFLQRNVHGIDVENNKIYLTKTSPSSTSSASLEGSTTTASTTTTTECIPYKSLVVATGSSINLSSIPGATKYALPFYTVQDCFELKKQLSVLDVYIQKILRSQKDQLNEKKEEVSIVIVGGGYSGVELALNLRQRLSIYDHGANSKTKGNSNSNSNENHSGVNIKITMIHRGEEVLQYANEYNRKNGQERLKSANINISTQQNVVEILPPAPSVQDRTSSATEKERAALKYKCQTVTSSTAETTSPTTLSTSTIDADILLWTAGAMAKNERRDILNSKLPRDNRGRIITNKYLHVPDRPNVYALGDCSRCKKVPYAATAAVAMQQAPVVAWNVFASTMNDSVVGKEDYDYTKTESELKAGTSTNMAVSGDKKKLELLPFDYLDLGQMMTLGSDDATISSPTGLFELEGSIASVARRLIYAVRMPTLQQALTATLSSTNKRLEKSSLSKVKKVIDWKQ